MSIKHMGKKAGLEKTVKYEKGTLRAWSKELGVKPVHEYSANEVKEIRKSCGLTQAMFAAFLGVSVKTVEAWERGRNCPGGSASRLLAMAEKDPFFPYSSGILSAAG
ncbi:MAG: helix-turn-helix domain-containing protein [Clostridia bacterium]|nr:helix-turn-helix domain-containing protein [Clostridia bacterium]